MLPDVYTTWPSMDMEEKQRFIRVATSKITLDKIAMGWFKFTVEWAPLLNEDKAGETLIDEAYISSPIGSDTAWTDEELDILKQHYATSGRMWLMEQLPHRSWKAICQVGRKYGSRPNMRRAGNENALTRRLSVSEIRLLEEYEIDANEMLAKGVVWKEYIDEEYTDIGFIGNSKRLY